MKKFQAWLYRFMYGRYGTDTLNTVILITALVIDLIGYFIGNSIVLILAEALLIWAIYRSFSRQIYKRSNENTLFLDKTKKIRRSFQVMHKNITDKSYRYYLCPKCAQIVRVPKNHGKVEITCPKCGESFTRNSGRNA